MGIIRKEIDPFYDMLCTRLESQYTDQLSIAIGGQKTHSAVTKDNWKQYCEDIEIPYNRFLEILESTISTLKEKLPTAVSNFDAEYRKDFRMPTPIFLKEEQTYPYFDKVIQAVVNKIEKNMVYLKDIINEQQNNLQF